MDVDGLLSRIGASLSVSRAFGDPYERDGVTVIPVAFVSGGGGGGGGTEAREPGDDSAEPGSGAGGGFGGVVLPFGVFEVREGRTRFVPAFSVNLALAVGALALVWLVRRRRRRA